VNVGGEWTERQWDRRDERNELEKLKIHTKFQLENKKEEKSRPRGNVKDNVMNWTYRITIPVAFRSVKHKFFLRYISSPKGKKQVSEY